MECPRETRRRRNTSLCPLSVPKWSYFQQLQGPSSLTPRHLHHALPKCRQALQRPRQRLRPPRLDLHSHQRVADAGVGAQLPLQQRLRPADADAATAAPLQPTALRDAQYTTEKRLETPITGPTQCAKVYTGTYALLSGVGTLRIPLLLEAPCRAMACLSGLQPCCGI